MIEVCRGRLEAVLSKPAPNHLSDIGNPAFFDPWEDVIQGIYGSYSSESDDLMLSALKAVRDRTTFDLIRERGFAAEFALYVLAGHGMTEYGGSPRGAWPAPDLADQWQPLIDKWESYATVQWDGE